MGLPPTDACNEVIPTMPALVWMKVNPIKYRYIKGFEVKQIYKTCEGQIA